MESFNEARFRVETGLNVTFVQDNESISVCNTLRGLHFQIPPKSQAKLVRVAHGAAWDVVVDLRVTEPTFGRWFKILLSAENKKQPWRSTRYSRISARITLVAIAIAVCCGMIKI
jgi:dTDP-4-dehydrorhamnose 3,5-epimerase